MADFENHDIRFLNEPNCLIFSEYVAGGCMWRAEPIQSATLRVPSITVPGAFGSVPRKHNTDRSTECLERGIEVEDVCFTPCTA